MRAFISSPRLLNVTSAAAVHKGDEPEDDEFKTSAAAAINEGFNGNVKPPPCYHLTNPGCALTTRQPVLVSASQQYSQKRSLDTELMFLTSYPKMKA